jgi:hypothetical protein
MLEIEQFNHFAWNMLVKANIFVLWHFSFQLAVPKARNIEQCPKMPPPSEIRTHATLLGFSIFMDKEWYI